LTRLDELRAEEIKAARAIWEMDSPTGLADDADAISRIGGIWESSSRKSVTRFVCTYIGRDQMRTLMHPAQGRYTLATQAEAEAFLAAIMENNSAETIAQLYGADPRPEVRPCPCYPGHFDPQMVWFD